MSPRANNRAFGKDAPDDWSGEARGSRLERGPGLWCSHAQARTPCRRHIGSKSRTTALSTRRSQNVAGSCEMLESAGPKRGGLKPAGKRQESATFLQRSFFDVAVQSFVCCSAASGLNDFRIAEKPMLQCSFCSAASLKLVFEVPFRLHVNLHFQ